MSQLIVKVVGGGGGGVRGVSVEGEVCVETGWMMDCCKVFMQTVSFTRFGTIHVTARESGYC